MKDFKIVLTGGPCAGKTKILDALIKYITEKYSTNLYIIPETATELINSGIIPTFYKRAIDFQDILFSRQINKEETTKEAVKKRKHNFLQNIIICDRGTIDNKAYLSSQSEFDIILEKYGYNEIALLDDCDLVIDLISTANSEYGIYDVESNKARYENSDEAKVLDLKTSNAWVGHRNLKIIDCMEKLESKKEVVINKTDQLIQGNQKQFLNKYLIDINNSDLSIYTDDNSKMIDIEETRLELGSEIGLEYKIIKRSYKGVSSYLLSLEKEKDGVRKLIYDNVIDEKCAMAIKNQAGIRNVIQKRRLSFIENKQVFNVDFYDDKCILVLESDSLNKNSDIPINIKVIEDIKEKNKIKTL